MEELLYKGNTYEFYLHKIDNEERIFTANFISIESPLNTLFVENYIDKIYGKLPGIRSMPFGWIKKIVLIETADEIDSIELTSEPIKKKKKKNKVLNNNFML